MKIRPYSMYSVGDTVYSNFMYAGLAAALGINLRYYTLAHPLNEPVISDEPPGLLSTVYSKLQGLFLELMHSDKNKKV